MSYGFLKRRKQSVMIRNAVDRCLDGICFGTEGGRPVLINKIMDALVKDILGISILNTEDMWTKLAQKQMTEEELPDLFRESPETLFLRDPVGAVWQLNRKTLSIGDGLYIQYTASDISELYLLQQKLNSNIRTLKQQKERQRVLLEEIVDNNRNNELLNVKIKIHDDFGQCLIASRQALRDGMDAAGANAVGTNADGMDTAAKGRLMRRWKYCIDSMLVSDAPPAGGESPEEELRKAAEMIGCRILFDGARPAERVTQLLLLAAVREALTNAVRHSRATQLNVKIREGRDGYEINITDNGHKNPGPVREGNGLGNLRRRLEQAGALMEIRCENGVELRLRLPKGEV